MLMSPETRARTFHQSKGHLESINITQQKINDFISNDNEDNPEYIEAIMEDIEDKLNNNGADENANIENDDNDETVSAQINENSEQVLFRGFDSP